MFVGPCCYFLLSFRSLPSFSLLHFSFIFFRSLSSVNFTCGAFDHLRHIIKMNRKNAAVYAHKGFECV